LIAFSSTNPDARSLTATTARIHYSLDATVSGTSVSGQATLKVSVGGSNDETGVGSGNDKGSGNSHENSDSTGTSLEVQATLIGMYAAAGLPLDPTKPTDPLACDPTGTATGTCKSEIPAVFVGAGYLKVKASGKTTDTAVAIMFESAYLNPFGRPLVIATIDATGTPDGMISIIATYNSQTSVWTGVQTAGDVFDPTSSTPTVAIGHFSLTSSLVEHLVKGTENDAGQHMTLFGFDFGSKYSVLNSVGNFKGISTIPKEGTPCLAWPFGAGTCLLTGARSTGSFNLKSTDKATLLGGKYDLSWSVPALGFVGTVGVTIGEEGNDQE